MSLNNSILHISYESLLTPNGVSVHVKSLCDFFDQSKALTIRNKISQLSSKEKNLNATTLFNEFNIFSLSSLRVIKMEIKKNDIIHLHLTNFTSILFVFLACFYNKKIVSTFHSVPKLSLHLIHLLEAIRMIIVYNLIVMFSDRIIVLSQTQSNLIVRFILCKKTYIKKIDIIGGFVKCKVKDSVNVRDQHQNLKIVCVGRLEKEKGFTELLQFLKKIKGTNVILYLIGTGSLRDLLPKDNRNLEYLGIMSNEDVINIMDKMDILISFSHNEAFPVTVIEAMSRGLALVLTRLPTLDELLTQNKNVLFFPVGEYEDAFKNVLYLENNVDLLTKLKYNNLGMARQFNLDEVSKKYINLYESI